MTKRTTALLGALFLGSLIACGDDDDAPATTAGAAGVSDSGAAGTGPGGTGGAGISGSSGQSSGGSSGQGGAGAAGAAQGGAGSGGAAGATLTAAEVVVAFSAPKGEFVEGLDVHAGAAYVGALPTGQIFKVDLSTKAVSSFGSTPAFTANQGALVGVSVDEDGTVYAALNVTDPAGPKTGVYRLPATGGVATLFAQSAEMFFANDIKIEATRLLVTDSLSGKIFAVAKASGAVTTWLASPLLAPDPDACKQARSFHLGVNGIVKLGDAYYVTHTDRGSIVKIPTSGDAAGEPSVLVAPDCAREGLDGITTHAGALYAAINYQNSVVRVDTAGTVQTLAKGDPLSSPASVIVDGDRLLITAAAFEKLATDPASAKPSLLSLAF